MRDNGGAEGVRALARVLEAAEAASPVEAVEAVTRELALALGATSVRFLVADLSGRALVRLVHVDVRDSSGDDDLEVLSRSERRSLGRSGESATVLPLDGGTMEQVVRTQQVMTLGPGGSDALPGSEDSWRVLAPVTQRGEVIGLLELLVPDEPLPETVVEISRLAQALAFVVIANRRHTDLYEWGQRTRPLSLSAEIQHRLLPGPQTCEARAFTLAGWLEPASDIAGDTFDFNLARDVLHLSITDAMGHGVGAALNATLCLGSLRNSRSEGATLAEQVNTANRDLAEHAAATGLEDFVTGLVGRVDLRAASLEVVNAGHVSPYLIRGSETAVLDLPVDLPLGLFPETDYRSSRQSLQPGDRLVLVTDGMLERNAANLDLAATIQETRSLHPREAVRAMADRTLEATGHQLRDDATILCLDWHGHHGDPRRSTYGADLARASRPGP